MNPQAACMFMKVLSATNSQSQEVRVFAKIVHAVFETRRKLRRPTNAKNLGDFALSTGNLCRLRVISGCLDQGLVRVLVAADPLRRCGAAATPAWAV